MDGLDDLERTITVLGWIQDEDKIDWVVWLNVD